MVQKTLVLFGIFGLVIEFVPMICMVYQIIEGERSSAIIFSAVFDFSKGLFIICTIPIWLGKTRHKRVKKCLWIEKIVWHFKAAIDTLISIIGIYLVRNEIYEQIDDSNNYGFILVYSFLFYAFIKIIRNIHYIYLVKKNIETLNAYKPTGVKEI